jgi:hypothetical protein
MGRRPFQLGARRVWKQLSEELGGDFQSDLDWRDERIVAQVDDWTVTIDLHQEHDSEREFTRIHATYLSADEFHFKIYRLGFWETVAKFFSIKDAPHLSLQDIEVGEPALDNMFVIQASDVVKIKRLLSNAKISHGLKTEPNILLYAEHLGKYPDGVDVVTLEVPERIGSLSRLEGLYELFSEVLHTMCQIGSAYDDDPNPKLSPKIIDLM